jgi:hypothetical protein
VKTESVKRVEEVETKLLPKVVISKGLKNLEPIATFEQYMEFLPSGSPGKRLSELFPELKLPEGKKIDGKTKDKSKHEVRYALSNWYFIISLLMGLDSRADDLIRRARHQLELTEMISRIKKLLPASTSPSRWTEAINIAEIVALLAKMRGLIVSNLLELCSFEQTRSSICAEYFEGGNLLVKALAVEIDELYERTRSSVQDYHRLLQELRSLPHPFETGWPQELCDIDVDALEHSAIVDSEVIVRVLVAFAKGKMLIAFDRIPEALETLKPYLQTNADDKEEE